LQQIPNPSAAIPKRFGPPAGALSLPSIFLYQQSEIAMKAATNVITIGKRLVPVSAVNSIVLVVD
jgi:hypothetical protein